MASGRSLFGNLMRGFLSKDSSIAAGILLALVVWTLTRIVNDITDHATIEYDVTYAAISLPDGRAGGEMSVVLSNLSHDLALQNLAAAITDPAGKAEFIATSARCAFPMPTWANDAVCAAHQDGLSFEAPWLIPGNRLSFSIRYAGSVEPRDRPIVRIRPSSGDSRLRLVTPGLQTWIVRNELPLLSGLLAVSVLLYCVSLAVGIPRD